MNVKIAAQKAVVAESESEIRTAVRWFQIPGVELETDLEMGDPNHLTLKINMPMREVDMKKVMEGLGFGDEEGPHLDRLMDEIYNLAQRHSMIEFFTHNVKFVR